MTNIINVSDNTPEQNFLSGLALLDGTVTETVTVGEGSGILTFTASAGTVALVSRHEPVSR